MNFKKELKLILIFFILIISSTRSFSQRATIDSLLNILDNTKDKDKANALNNVSKAFLDSSIELSIKYAEKAISLSKKLNNAKEEANGYVNIAAVYNYQLNDNESLKYYLKALKINEQLNSKTNIPSLQNLIGLEYFYINNVDSAFIYFNKAFQSSSKFNNKKENANALGKIGFVLKQIGKLDSAIIYTEKALNISEEIKDDVLIARFLRNLGNIYVMPDKEVNDNKKAIEYYTLCAETNKKLGDSKASGSNYYAIGRCNLNIGKYDEANKYFQESISIFKKIDFKKGILQNYNGLANVYELWAQSQRANSYPQALEYYQKSLKVNKELQDKKTEAEILNNIGNLFSKQLADFLEKEMGIDWEEIADTYNFSSISLDDSSLTYYNKSLKLSEERHDQAKIAQTLNNLGTINAYIGQYKKSKEYYLKAVKINEDLHSVNELIINYRALGRVYKREKNYQQALDMFNKSLSLALNNDIKIEIQYGYEDISKTYQKLGQYKKAFDNYRLFVLYKDSVFSANSQKIITELQVKYESAETKRMLEKQQAASALQELQIKKQKILIFVAVAILVLIVFFLIYIFQQNKKIKKVNDQLEEQNELIMDQKKEITDSIHYASRIQRAILPPDELLDRILPDKFLLFKPRDIVSGDYYYINEKNGKVIVIAADCTGHGVPGAFMSMLGTAFLNEIVGSDQEPHSDFILNQLREHVIRSLHQTGKSGESQDGMDLAIYVLDFENKKLEFSGANNPLVIIRKGEVLETKADKMPIGIHVRAEIPFVRNEIDVQKGDVIYTFSDGFQDQFGGPKGKKFMIKNMKALLTEIYKDPMEKQKQKLDDVIENWMENTEQIDDILVIGVRI